MGKKIYFKEGSVGETSIAEAGFVRHYNIADQPFDVLYPEVELLRFVNHPELELRDDEAAGAAVKLEEKPDAGTATEKQEIAASSAVAASSVGAVTAPLPKMPVKR